MFGGYDDVEAFEDELYREESSSEESIDSEVECHLYSQVHYAQDLSLVNGQEEESGPVSDELHSKDSSGLRLLPDTPKVQTHLIVLSDTDYVQISDGPEVITLSDTTEEDSVYRCKGNRKGVALHSRVKLRPCSPFGQSTPNNASIIQSLDSSDFDDPRPKRKRKKDNHDKPSLIDEVLVTVDSSAEEGECESDDDDDDQTTLSESDNLENWMLLGSGEEDADTSIQLNIEGCGTSVGEGAEGGVDWSIGDKDLEAQISNYTPVRRMNRYYSLDKNIICRNCDKRGHLSKNCSVPRKLPACCLCGTRGHLQNSCPERFCSNCFSPGHFAKECIERAYWKKDCHRCSMTGHYADACPEIWRQYHLTIQPGPIQKPCSTSGKKANVYCYNCSKKGHYGHECSERRMFHGAFPACPFINVYDRDYEVLKRSKRMELKVKDLQESGLLPMNLKKPRQENEQSHHTSKKKKKHYDRESKKGHGEYHCHKESKKKMWTERDHGMKHKKPYAPWGYNTEEDFPRGTSFYSNKRNTDSPIKDFDPLLIKHVKRAQSAGYLQEEVKKKRRIKHKGRQGHSPGPNENLFCIKQRHKKSKKHLD
ncbi:zinc finger CCHC domain-containing protein 7 [Ambystoma mexicanum]|uniref:zinc finger CCHC domain-containing protein 7 n=1 Tax=Ambystoma mexicanum TaxID=8296 RepID=UPI0037E8FC72